jgi:four helix bundle protein
MMVIDAKTFQIGSVNMNREELTERTKEFAHRCVKLTMALPETPLGKHIGGQLIRCSTSVAANYRAACLSQSSASFVAKLSIVLEEADEAAFWLEFIIDENLQKENLVKPLLLEAEELTKIFAAARKTASTKN